MVLVRHEIPARAKALQNQSNSNAGSSAEGSSAQVSLSDESHATALQVEPQPTISSYDRWDQSSRWSSRLPYQTQLALLEQQNKKRLLAARRLESEQRQEEEGDKRVNAKSSKDSNASSREDYHLQQMALEQENGKRLMGTRPQLPTLGSGSRNQGHDAQSTVGGFRTQGQISQLAQLKILEEQDERRSAIAHDRSPRPNRHECESVKDDGNVESLDYYRSAPQDIPTMTEDKTRRTSFPAIQDDVQWVALENGRREDFTPRSQTEVEFGQQRSRYLTEEAEMSRFSGQNLPGAPGRSCSPPSFANGNSLASRAVTRPDVEFDDLYDH